MYVEVDLVTEHQCSVVSTAGERKIQACNPKNSACGKVLRVVPNRELAPLQRGEANAVKLQPSQSRLQLCPLAVPS